MSFDAIEIQMATRVAISTIFEGSTKLRNDFREKKLTVLEVDYLEESDMLRPDMRKSTVNV